MHHNTIAQKYPRTVYIKYTILSKIYREFEGNNYFPLLSLAHLNIHRRNQTHLFYIFLLLSIHVHVCFLKNIITLYYFSLIDRNYFSVQNMSTCLLSKFKNVQICKCDFLICIIAIWFTDI